MEKYLQFNDQNEQNFSNTDKLRSKLEVGSYDEIQFEEILKSADENIAVTCIDLLSFNQFHHFQKLRKKRNINEQFLLSHPQLKSLYLDHHTSTKLKGKTSQQISQKFNGQREKEGEKGKVKINKKQKFVLMGLVLILLIGGVVKYRKAIVGLIKVVLNIK